MKDFISGMQLSRRFYDEVVKDIIESNFPELKYSIGLLGHGSEVLGYDTEISTDHDWGPRLVMFLDESNYSKRDEINSVLSEALPETFMGYSVKPDNVSDTRKEETKQISMEHRVEITTSKLFFDKELGVDISEELELTDWLVLPNKLLLSITRGEIFFDGLDEIEKLREKFSYYPKDVWLYVLASQWHRISEEDSFMGRAGDVGDDLGSQIITARLVRYIMELCFMMEKKYIPYIKWFGTAFTELECSEDLSPVLKRAMSANNWEERQDALSEAYRYVAIKHNELSITEPMSTEVTPFFGRPYLVIQGGAFEESVRKEIKNETLKSIGLKTGNVDQLVDRPDIPTNKEFLSKVKSLFE